MAEMAKNHGQNGKNGKIILNAIFAINYQGENGEKIDGKIKNGNKIDGENGENI